MTVAVVDSGSGNLRSVAKALERAVRERGETEPVAVTSDADVVARADRIVLPGVGAFGDCRRGLDRLPGMVAALEESVRRRGVPFLGICVGMQLMAARGYEHGVYEGLGWIGGEVVQMTGAGLKVPHMGWNDLRLRAPAHPVLAGLATGDHAYFVHGYRMECADPADVLASVAYAGPVTAVVGRSNLVGTQFHPEKSQAVGLRLIANFLAWRP